ncbi:tRNA pseudouridine(38-40) synthase TruA [Endothiovibrio diazotrophicus]
MRIALGIEYDGSGFHGWQTQQPGVRAVQTELERALAKVAAEPIHLFCAGRTDTGVHGVGQVVHFETGAGRAPRSWILGGNSNLPEDVRVHWARPVDDDFHARFSARRRAYRYVILNRWIGSAILRRRVVAHRFPLDEGRMAAAAARLLGEHDFSSFRAQGCQAKSPVRTMLRAEVTRSGDFIYLDVEANAFLHHMVRNIAGVLMEIGEGKREPEWVDELLAVRDRTLGGVTAPPDGLYLVSVGYDDYDLPAPPPPPVFG